jgi:hypothetical protein
VLKYEYISHQKAYRLSGEIDKHYLTHHGKKSNISPKQAAVLLKAMP